MKKLVIITLIAFLGGIFFSKRFLEKKIAIPEMVNNPVSKPLEKYTIDNLSKANVKKNSIEIGELLSENKNFNSYLFLLNFDPTLQSSKVKKVTGLINIPNGTGPFPLILMIRGYIDQKIYQTGMGTKRAGEYFSNNGFITIAPDFLGYGKSDPEAENIFESRFQTYTTTISLLNAIYTLPQFDGKNIFIWAHSNGGQIALTTLAITQKDYPTTLWAPVTKPFPYNVLYYTDEAYDGGKFIRKELAAFENLYDTNLYSFTNYLDRIKSKIILHQGTSDDAVPVSWSNNFVKSLKKLNKNITYYKYDGANHNLEPSWNEVVKRDLAFFKNNLN